MRKIKSRSGFSLIETLLSALLFTFVVMAIGSAIIVSVEWNARASRFTEARLAVSNAVETIMAEGFNADASKANYDERFPDVTITGVQPMEGAEIAPYYRITVEANSDLKDRVSVTTCVKPFVPVGGDE